MPACCDNRGPVALPASLFNTPPYDENWHFFKKLSDEPAMHGRGLVLTTTNKARLDEVAGPGSEAIEIVGKPYDLAQIKHAITAALQRVATKS